jgi:hypothetical protein
VQQSATCSTLDGLSSSIATSGFAFARGDAMRGLLGASGSLEDWAAFASSWDRLSVDTYMADGGRYRRRRYAAYLTADDRTLSRGPHQPHFQALDYNPLNGGIARWFDPIEDEPGQSASLRSILTFGAGLFQSLCGLATPWHIEVHQFRIEARTGEQGQPTPEGLHRDGVDYVLVLLVDRRNIASGVTSIHAPDGRMLGQFTLTTPLDTALVDDGRVAHGVTPVQPIDTSLPAYRDVLVATYSTPKRAAELARAVRGGPGEPGAP